MQVKKYIRINDDQSLVKVNSPDSNTVKVRALETETLQTKQVSYYLVDNEYRIISLIGLIEQIENNEGEYQLTDLIDQIKNALSVEIYKGNEYFSEFGIDVQISLEVLLVHEPSELREVPSITTYPQFLERETIDYLNYSESISTETYERIAFINHGIKTLKDSPFWLGFDVISIFAQSSIWLPLNLNKNLKIDAPNSWLNSYPGNAGEIIPDVGIKLSCGNQPNYGFINLGYQQFAPDFNLYFPNRQYAAGSSSVTVMIKDWVTGSSGLLYRLGRYQDYLMYDNENEVIKFNLFGYDNETDGVTFPFTGNVNGIWTINRTSYEDIEIWKDGVILNEFSGVFTSGDPITEKYASCGYGIIGPALECTFQAVTMGRRLEQNEVGPFHIFLNQYMDNLSDNNFEGVDPIVIENPG